MSLWDGQWGYQDWQADRIVGGKFEGQLRVQLYLAPCPQAAHELCMAKAASTPLPTEVWIGRYASPNARILIGDICFGAERAANVLKG